MKEPTDADVNAWYESNESRIPPNYKLEQITGEIKNVLKNEQKKAKRDEVLAKLCKDGGLALATKERSAPQFKIDCEAWPKRGAKDAKLVLVEFADYMCPHCKHAGEALEKVLKKFEGKVALTYLDLTINGDASNQLSYGAFCADQQGKFWDYHDMAFAKQGSPEPKALAKELKLDEAKFGTCLGSPEAQARVAKSKAEGERIGITGTPASGLDEQPASAQDFSPSRRSLSLSKITHKPERIERGRSPEALPRPLDCKSVVTQVTVEESPLHAERAHDAA